MDMARSFGLWYWAQSRLSLNSITLFCSSPISITTGYYQMFFYLWTSLPLRPSFALTALYCPNLVPLLLVRWQSPPCKLTIASEYFAGMKSLATFRATINSISIRNKILLITPVVHILSHRRRSVLEQVETRAPTLKGSFRAWKRDYRPHFGLLLYPFSNHFNPIPWPGAFTMNIMSISSSTWLGLTSAFSIERHRFAWSVSQILVKIPRDHAIIMLWKINVSAKQILTCEIRPNGKSVCLCPSVRLQPLRESRQRAL